MKQKEPTIYVKPDNFQMFLNEIKIGVIKQARLSDAGLLAPHIESHIDSLYVACSGIAIPQESCWFSDSQPAIGLEWVRVESKPTAGEPECNNYRYIFGLSKKDKKKYLGWEVTNFNAGNGQVAPHWADLDEMYNLHFPNGSPEYL